MVVDNKVGDITTLLSTHGRARDASTESELSEQEQLLIAERRCHERCRCKKCRRIIAAAAGHSQDRVTSSWTDDNSPDSVTSSVSTGVLASGRIDVDVDRRVSSSLQSFSVPNGQLPSASTPDDTDSQVPSSSDSFSVPNGHLPSAPQTVSASHNSKDRFPTELGSSSTPNGRVLSALQSASMCNQTEDQVASYTGVESVLLPAPTVISTESTHDKAHVPDTTTSAESTEVSFPPTSDSKACVPATADILTSKAGVPSSRCRGTCHPLCSCEHCSQLVVYTDCDVVETRLDPVYCRSDHGFSGQSHTCTHARLTALSPGLPG